MSFGEVMQLCGLIAGLGGAGLGGTLLTRFLDARASARKRERESEAQDSATLDRRQSDYMDRLERLVSAGQKREAALVAMNAELVDQLTDVYRWIANGQQGDPPEWKPLPPATGVLT